MELEAQPWETVGLTHLSHSSPSEGVGGWGGSCRSPSDAGSREEAKLQMESAGLEMDL